MAGRRFRRTLFVSHALERSALFQWKGPVYKMGQLRYCYEVGFTYEPVAHGFEMGMHWTLSVYLGERDAHKRDYIPVVYARKSFGTVNH